MTKEQSKNKIALAIDLIQEVGRDGQITDSYSSLAEMAMAGKTALAILTREAEDERAEFLTKFRSITA